MHTGAFKYGDVLFKAARVETKLMDAQQDS
jgi:hypothetical protein